MLDLKQRAQTVAQHREGEYGARWKVILKAFELAEDPRFDPGVPTEQDLRLASDSSSMYSDIGTPAWTAGIARRMTDDEKAFVKMTVQLLITSWTDYYPAYVGRKPVAEPPGTPGKFILYDTAAYNGTFQVPRVEQISWHVRNHPELGYRSFASVQAKQLRLFPSSAAVPTGYENCGWGWWPGREGAEIRELERQLCISVLCYSGEVVNSAAVLSSLASRCAVTLLAAQDARELAAARIKLEQDRLQAEWQEHDRKLREEEEARKELIKTKYWRHSGTRLDR